MNPDTRLEVLHPIPADSVCLVTRDLTEAAVMFVLLLRSSGPSVPLAVLLDTLELNPARVESAIKRLRARGLILTLLPI